MKLYISEATLRTIEKFGSASLTHISATPSDHMSIELDAAPLATEASKPAPSVEQDAHAHPFAALCDLLPSDVSWGDALTPDLARHIARAASTSANGDRFDPYRLKVAEECCERLMSACTDAGCPDGVRMDDWIRENIRSTSANVAQGAEAVATVKVYETYTGQNGWTEVAQEEYDRTKDKYEHRIRRVPAPPAQTALTDDARECLLDVTTHFDNLRAGLCAQRSEATNSDDGDGIAYWNREIRVLERMKAQAERALTAAQSASGDTK